MNKIIELLERAIELEDVSKGIFIVYVKPKNKNRVIEYDTDNAAFDILENELLFDFWDETYKSFSIKISDIKDVKIEEFNEDMTITFIYLKNGNTIMIHSFKDK